MELIKLNWATTNNDLASLYKKWQNTLEILCKNASQTKFCTAFVKIPVIEER